MLEAGYQGKASMFHNIADGANRSPAGALTRRNFIGVAAVALIPIPFGSCFWRLPIREHDITLKFQGPFSDGDRLWDSNDHNREQVPFDPYYVAIGNNDVALWYNFPPVDGRKSPAAVTLTLCAADGHILATSTKCAHRLLAKHIFQGANIRFRVDKDHLKEASSMTLKIDLKER